MNNQTTIKPECINQNKEVPCKVNVTDAKVVTEENFIEEAFGNKKGCGEPFQKIFKINAQYPEDYILCGFTKIGDEMQFCKKCNSQNKCETSTIQDLHETRLELMKEAKKAGMSYNDYVTKDIEFFNREENRPKPQITPQNSTLQRESNRPKCNWVEDDTLPEKNKVCGRELDEWDGEFHCGDVHEERILLCDECQEPEESAPKELYEQIKELEDKAEELRKKANHWTMEHPPSETSPLFHGTNQELVVLCKFLRCGVAYYTKEKDELIECPVCNCRTKHKYKYQEEKCECNCGGIKGEDWSHEEWCNSQEQDVTEEKK